jgi:hypothetical protein
VYLKTITLLAQIGFKAMANVVEAEGGTETEEQQEKVKEIFKRKYFSQERNILLQRMDVTFKRCLDTFVNEVQS